jgi:SPP1 family predicted phage head-tail adaptor
MPVGRQVLQGRAAEAAGQRDKYVLIEQGITAKGPSGFPVETWTALGYAWMSRKDVTADERFAAGQESAFAGTIWVMPYQSNMDPESLNVPKVRRLSFKGRIYDIIAATAVGRQRSIEMLTLAKVG